MQKGQEEKKGKKQKSKDKNYFSGRDKVRKQIFNFVFYCRHVGLVPTPYLIICPASTKKSREAEEMIVSRWICFSNPRLVWLTPPEAPKVSPVCGWFIITSPTVATEAIIVSISISE